jgi:hypothetical protein
VRQRGQTGPGCGGSAPRTGVWSPVRAMPASSPDAEPADLREGRSRDGGAAAWLYQGRPQDRPLRRGRPRDRHGAPGPDAGAGTAPDGELRGFLTAVCLGGPPHPSPSSIAPHVPGRQPGALWRNHSAPTSAVVPLPHLAPLRGAHGPIHEALATSAEAASPTLNAHAVACGRYPIILCLGQPEAGKGSSGPTSCGHPPVRPGCACPIDVGAS